VRVGLRLRLQVRVGLRLRFSVRWLVRLWLSVVRLRLRLRLRLRPRLHLRPAGPLLSFALSRARCNASFDSGRSAAMPKAGAFEPSGTAKMPQGLCHKWLSQNLCTAEARWAATERRAQGHTTCATRAMRDEELLPRPLLQRDTVIGRDEGHAIAARAARELHSDARRQATRLARRGRRRSGSQRDVHVGEGNPNRLEARVSEMGGSASEDMSAATLDLGPSA